MLAEALLLMLIQAQQLPEFVRRLAHALVRSTGNALHVLLLSQKKQQHRPVYTVQEDD
jgi:hypothetical protein